MHSLIGLFAGVFGNAPGYTQLTHGVFDDIFAALEQQYVTEPIMQ